jgi:hypothetical protein
MLNVNYNELRNAFEFVSSASLATHSAYICLDTANIYWVSNSLELEEIVPQDIETSERYIAVPHKNELQLGQKIALEFIQKTLPNDYNLVSSYFRKRGAYRRFRELLEVQGLLESWFLFETQACDSALLDWCEELNIQIIFD